MLVEDVRIVPIAIVRFSPEEIDALARAATRQIDSKSKAMLYEGGLIYTMARGLKVHLTASELAALIEVTKQTHCMMADYDVQVLHDGLVNLVRRFGQTNT